MERSSLLDRLSDDADVGDARLLDGIHDRGEGAKGNALIGPEVDNFLTRITLAGPQQRGKLVYIDWLVLQEDVLLPVDGDDHALLGELIHRARLGDSDFNTRLQHWSSQDRKTTRLNSSHSSISY